MNGVFFEIKRFAIHDGPGIRTTLFLKGCSLRCCWCHNPESIFPKPELGYFAHKCFHCGECVTACPVGAHLINSGRHGFERARCCACGECETVCPGRALRLFGRPTTVEAILPDLLDDREFFAQSGGGVTVSGGEPLLQTDFTVELFQRLQLEKIHCALDTCGNVSWGAFEKVLPYTDLVLYDLKHTDPEQHERLTGRRNERILKNLAAVSAYGVPIEIRLPLIPGMNDSEQNLKDSADLLGKLSNITAVRLLAYHEFARSKYAAMGMEDTMPNVSPPESAAMERAAGFFRAVGLPVILL